MHPAARSHVEEVVVKADHPGHDGVATQIHHLGPVGDRHVACGADGGNARALDHDGLIARRYGSGTQLGIFFDLVGDKLVVAALVITMVELGWIPGWIAAGFIGRELFVMGMRAYAGAQGVTVSAGQLGKMKMMWQYIGLAALIWDRVPLTWALVLFALAMTVASGLYYLVSVTRELRGRPAPDVPEPL